MPEDFSGCENFRNLRKFAGCEKSQAAKIRRLPKFAGCEILQVTKVRNLALFTFFSSLHLFVSCNPSFDAPEINFSNLLSHSN